VTSKKKKAPAKTVRKLRDLKSRNDPKGGQVYAGTPVATAPSKITTTGWIEVNSLTFGVGRSNP
jgi:hypothetical protein